MRPRTFTRGPTIRLRHVSVEAITAAHGVASLRWRRKSPAVLCQAGHAACIAAPLRDVARRMCSSSSVSQDGSMRHWAGDTFLSSSSSPSSSHHAYTTPREAREPSLSSSAEEGLLEAFVATIPFAPQAMRVSTLYQTFTSPPPPSHTPARSNDCTSIPRQGSGGSKAPGTASREIDDRGVKSAPVAAAGPARRAWIRHRFRTIKNLLIHLCHENDDQHWGVYLSYDGLLVTRAANEHEAGEAFRSLYAIEPMPQKESTAGAKRVPGSTTTATSPRLQVSVIAPNEFQPCDYCYPIEGSSNCGGGVPTDGSGTFAALQARRASVNAALTLRTGPSTYSLSEIFMPDVDEDLLKAPPPPPSPPSATVSTASPSMLASSRSRGTPGAATDASGDRPTAPAQVNLQSPSTFTPQMLVTLLPTYFIPLEDFLAQLPAGYTPEHVARIFAPTGCVEMVTLPVPARLNRDKTIGMFGAEEQAPRAQRDGAVQTHMRTFVRLHGGRSHVAFGVTATSEQDATSADADGTARSVHEHFAPSYAPDPFLCDAFARALDTPAEDSVSPMAAAHEWRPLGSLIQHGTTPPHLLAALGPFLEDTEVLPLLYFGQMQHRFQFALDRGAGLLCTIPSVEASRLREETTPVPIAVAEVAAILHAKGRIYVTDLEQPSPSKTQERAVGSLSAINADDAALRLSDFSKRLILSFFGTLRAFLAAHPDIFVLADAQQTAAAPSSSAPPVADPIAEAVSSVEEQEPLPQRQVRSPRHSGFAPARAPRGELSHMLHSPNLTVELSPSRANRQGGHHAPHLHPPSPARNKTSSATAHPSSADDRPGVDLVTCSPSSLASLEDRLERALLRKDRRAARKARRRLAIASNPDSPYADAQVLLDAVLRYLPARRPVSLRYFVKALPTRLSDFMPEVPLQFFKAGVPHKVQIFEWRRRNALYLLRPGVPLPDGRLRDTYTERELLFMVAEELAHASRRSDTGLSVSSLFSQLPYGARMTLGNGNKPFLIFLQRYPEHFLIVFPDAVRMDVRAARVSLLAPPAIAPEELGAELRASHVWEAMKAPPSPAEMEEWEAMDQVVMQERMAEVAHEGDGIP